MILTVLALLLFLVGLAYLVLAFRALKRTEIVGTLAHVSVGSTLFVLSLLLILGFITLRGYRAFTYEDLAVTIHVEPIQEGLFYAHFSYPDGKKYTYKIAGEELYVDARVLKWKPLANFLGVHTSYQLDRVSGRYHNVMDEINKQRSLFPLNDENKYDLFQMRKKFSSLTFLVDAEYGSASFVPMKEGYYTLMVSTTGLLFREKKLTE